MTSGRKVWDICSPFITLLLCFLACTMVGTMGFGLLTGLQYLGSEGILEAFPWLTVVITCISYIVVCILLRSSYRMDQARFGFDKKEWKIVQYAAAVALTMAAGHLWSTAIYFTGIHKVFTGYEEFSSVVFQRQNLILMFLMSVVTAPIGEELVFRAFIYRRAKHHFGKVTGILVSSLLFGIYHANLIQFIYATVFGILLACIYEKSGNFLAPVLAHAGANLWAIVIDALQIDGTTILKVILAAEVVIAVVCVYLLFGQSGQKKS